MRTGQSAPAVRGRTAVFLVDGIPSHAYSSMGVAARLARHGYNVEYWGSATNRAKDLLCRAGYRYRTIDGLWSRYPEEIRIPTDLNIFTMALHPRLMLQKLIARRAFARRLASDLAICEASLDRLLAEVRPAFIVLDAFLLAYFPLAWARGIRTVVLSTKPLPIADPRVPPYDSSLMPPTSAITRARVRICWLQRRLNDIGYRAMQKVARTLSAYTYHDLLRESARRSSFPLRREIVRRWIQPDLNFKSVHEWALWLPQTDLPREKPVPDNVSYIGPCIDIARREAPWTAALRLDGKPLIYVAVGTVRFRWKDNVPFLKKAIEAFGALDDVRVLVSTSDERATKMLGTPPPNTTVVDFVPQLKVLEVASLAVTHAGSGTYRECIHRQVPMLAYPRNHDQTGIAARIAFHGIGLRGDRDRDTVADIRAKAERILHDPSFRSNLARLHAVSEHSQERLLSAALDKLMAGDGVDSDVAGEPRLAVRSIAG